MTVVDPLKIGLGVVFLLAGLAALWLGRGERGLGQKRQIGSLLGRTKFSILDRLMEIPAPLSGSASDAPEWDAAVVRRLEARLADTMREIIEPGVEKKPG